MKFQLTLDDTAYEQLEQAAKTASKSISSFLKDNLDILCQINPKDNQILLSGKEVDQISQVYGGKTIRSGKDLVNLFKGQASVSVDGVAMVLDPEDLNAFKEQYSGFEWLSYAEYLTNRIQEAIHMDLWGSYKGTLTYR